jgi:lysyl-tRNA synthetase class 1
MTNLSNTSAQTDTEQNSRYWLDQVINRVAEEVSGQQEIIVSSGITPSGPYHVGHSREILTGDALYKGLRSRGMKVRHLHFVDAYDALRKRYPYLPEEYEQEAGKPVYLVPAPDGNHSSYADQYFSSYKEAADLLGIDMEVLWTQDEYIAGKYADIIVESLQKRDQIALILERVSGRAVDGDWQPIQILDETNSSLRTATFESFDADNQTVSYVASDGSRRVADMKKGQVKLDWRCDWPARWTIFGVTVEGFGREHATKGGSYDTGKAIVEEVYGGKAPIPVPYDTINLKGDTKKMSSSLGNLVTIQDSLKIIPPEILRFFVFKSLPQKQLFFDPGMGMYTLIDEVAKIEEAFREGVDHEFSQAWAIAQLSREKASVAQVPFSHLVTVYQTAQGDFEQALELLRRTGHAFAADGQVDVLKREFGYVQRWLADYAPEQVKFGLQPVGSFARKLTDDEEAFLNTLNNKLDVMSTDASGEVVHAAIYDSTQQAGIAPKAAFTLLYEILFNQPTGPRLGHFIAGLGKDKTIIYLETALQK